MGLRWLSVSVALILVAAISQWPEAYAQLLSLPQRQTGSPSDVTALDCAKLKAELTKGHKLTDDKQGNYTQCVNDKPKSWIAPPVETWMPPLQSPYDLFSTKKQI